MKKSDVLALSSMPLQSPTYPLGPYKFFNRQYLVINYRTDPDAMREHLPEPLEPAGNSVAVQWLDLPDGEGFGAYSAAAQIIPCTFQGKACSFVSQMYVDNSPPKVQDRSSACASWPSTCKTASNKIARRSRARSTTTSAAR